MKIFNIELISNKAHTIAGLWYIGTFFNTPTGPYCGVHLFPAKRHRQWGFAEIWYNGAHRSFGLGPLAIFVWGV